MKDEVLRVVRDPIRKLSPRERLVAPALLAVEYHLPRRWIVKAIAAALKYHHAKDAESERLQEKIRTDGLAAVLQDVCGIHPDHPLAAEITDAWATWDF